MNDKLRRDRKYKAFWAYFLLMTVLLVFNRLSGEQYVEVIIFGFGLYMAGNVGEHWSKAIKTERNQNHDRTKENNPQDQASQASQTG